MHAGQLKSAVKVHAPSPLDVKEPKELQQRVPQSVLSALPCWQQLATLAVHEGWPQNALCSLQPLQDCAAAAAQLPMLECGACLLLSR